MDDTLLHIKERRYQIRTQRDEETLLAEALGD